MPALARRRLLKIRAVLDDVSVVARPREVVRPPMTRLNQRYEPALRLAALILRAASIDAPKGALAATAFVFDMNKVFEDFVTTALRESMVRFGGELRAQWRGRLDIERQLQIIPDLTWWVHGSCAAVADAKYKALTPSGMPNADAYQMLAYCTALTLERGFLIYAADAGEQVKNPSCAELDRRRGGSHSGSRDAAGGGAPPGRPACRGDRRRWSLLNLRPLVAGRHLTVGGSEVWS